MSRHQIVIEVDTTEGITTRKIHGSPTAYGLMLTMVDLAEDRNWLVTDAFVREVTKEDE